MENIGKILVFLFIFSLIHFLPLFSQDSGTVSLKTYFPAPDGRFKSLTLSNYILLKDKKNDPSTVPGEPGDLIFYNGDFYYFSDYYGDWEKLSINVSELNETIKETIINKDAPEDTARWVKSIPGGSNCSIGCSKQGYFCVSSRLYYDKGSITRKKTLNCSYVAPVPGSACQPGWTNCRMDCRCSTEP